MSGERPRSLPSWTWIVAASLIVGVPIVISIAVPSRPIGTRPANELRGWTDSINPAPTRVPPPAQAVAVSPSPDTVPSPAGANDVLDPSVHRSDEAAFAAVEAEMTDLKVEKAAIETQAEKLRKDRDDLENFESEHSEGVSPELYSRYEDARAKYNSDVKAFQSRKAAYEMKVAELERRIDSLNTHTR